MNIRLQSNPNLTLHSTDNYYGIPIQTLHGALIANYLNTIQATLQNAVNDHPRTCAMRVDLRLPNQAEPISPRIVSKFFDSLKAQIKADLIKKQKKRGRTLPCSVRHIWVKEKNNALNWHYHVLILVNNDCYNCLGQFEKMEGNMAARIKKAWASALGCLVEHLGGLVHFPKKPIYHLIKPSKPNLESESDPELRSKMKAEYEKALKSFHVEFNALFHRVSYFAKAKTKNFGDGNNAFGSSRK